MSKWPEEVIAPLTRPIFHRNDPQTNEAVHNERINPLRVKEKRGGKTLIIVGIFFCSQSHFGINIYILLSFLLSRQ